MANLCARERINPRQGGALKLCLFFGAELPPINRVVGGAPWRVDLMAKIQTTALISEIHGKLAGSSIRRSRSGLSIYSSKTSRNPRTASQQATRMKMSELSSKWYPLSATVKSMWKRYASMIGVRSSGYNVFIGLNMSLFKAGHVDLVEISIPPLTPATPRAVSGLGIVQTSIGRNVVSWASPASSDVYVSVYASIQIGKSQTQKESWKLIETLKASEGQITHDTGLPDSFGVAYRVQTIDTSGRRSPVSEIQYGWKTPVSRGGIMISDAQLGAHAENVRDAFLYGYGDGWTGETITIKADGFLVDLQCAYDNNFSLFVRSTTGIVSKIPSAALVYPAVQLVMPAGSNSHYQIYDSGGNMPVIIPTGGGDSENETAWDVEFFAPDPFTPEPSDTSSYGNGVVAGQICKIRDLLQCSFWEARYRARATASNNGIWDAVNGYGLINTEAAVSFFGVIPPDPYL